MEHMRKKLHTGGYEYRGHIILGFLVLHSHHDKWKVIESSYERGRIIYYAVTLAQSTRWIDKKLEKENI